MDIQIAKNAELSYKALRSHYHYKLLLSKRLTGQFFVAFEVDIDGLLCHIFGKFPALFGIGFQPVAGELLVEGRLSVAGFINIGRPETGAVGGQHFIAQYHIAVFIQTEFKLGVCDNDASCQGIFRTLLVKSNGVILNLGCVFLTLAGEVLFQVGNALLERNIFIMVANLGFGRRGVNGFRQLVGLL